MVLQEIFHILLLKYPLDIEQQAPHEHKNSPCFLHDSFTVSAMHFS